MFALDRLRAAVGGPGRLRVIALLAAALALAGGDQTVAGAVAPDLKITLGIDNTAIGLLATAASLTGAVTTLPFGMLADRVNRVRLLAVCVLAWSVAVTIAGFATSYPTLLLAQVALGAGVGAATPVVASLTGDLFASQDRGRVFGFILAGEFAGAASGLLIAGQMSAWWSWRGAFWVLAAPGPLLALALLRGLAEPMRGAFDATQQGREENQASVAALVIRAGVPPVPGRVLTEDPTDKPMRWAIRYVLGIRTNVLLIVATALVYSYVAGLQTFAIVFLRGRFDLGQSLATVLLVVVGLGVIVGTLLAGPLSDRAIGRGRIAARPLIGGLFCLVGVMLFAPGYLLPASWLAYGFLVLGSAGLGGVTPPLDAARLDIVHSRLWGRAESVRNFIQTLLKAGAPVLFGYLSTVLGGDSRQAQGDGAVGLTRTFLLMLGVLVISGVVLLGPARRRYPRDVATAIASEQATAAANDEDKHR